MKKKIIVMLLSAVLALSAVSCGQKSGTGGTDQTGKMENEDEAGDIEADTGEPDEASAHPLKEYVFSQDVLDKDLEKPIRAYGFEYLLKKSGSGSCIRKTHTAIKCSSWMKNSGISILTSTVWIVPGKWMSAGSSFRERENTTEKGRLYQNGHKKGSRTFCQTS